jgi:hypothetical protein
MVGRIADAKAAVFVRGQPGSSKLRRCGRAAVSSESVLSIAGDGNDISVRTYLSNAIYIGRRSTVYSAFLLPACFWHGATNQQRHQENPKRDRYGSMRKAETDHKGEAS